MFKMDDSRIPHVILRNGLLYAAGSEIEFFDYIIPKKFSFSLHDFTIESCCMCSNLVYFVSNSRVFRWNLEEITDLNRLEVDAISQCWQVVSKDQFVAIGTDLDISLRFCHFGLRTVKYRETRNEIFSLILTATDNFVYLLDNRSENSRLICIDKVGTEFEAKIIQLGLQDGCKIVQISSGKAHTILLDSWKNVYSFGIGSRGELGHQSLLDNENLPKWIEAFDNVKVKQISAGGWHSAVVTEDGDIYFWGWNESGQLGIPQNETPTSTVPLPLELNDELSVVESCCGARHTVFRTTDQQVFGCGSNQYNQLGCKKSESEPFTKISDRSVGVLCSGWTTIVIN